MATRRHTANILLIYIILLISVYTKAQEKTEIISEMAERRQVQSPNYPEDYPPNLHKVWIFNQTIGYWIITIEDINLQDSQNCQNDYLLIRPSKSLNITPRKLCGTMFTHSIISDGPYLQIIFHSDNVGQAKGFSSIVRHVMNKDELEKLNEQIKGKEVKLLTHVENQELFFGLLGVLSLAAVLFFAMLGCFVVGLMKRHHESVLQRNMVSMLQTQVNNQPLERRYSRKGSVKEQKKPVFMQSLSNQSTTALLSYQSAGYPQTGDHV